MDFYEIIMFVMFMTYIGTLGYKLHSIFRIGENSDYAKIFLGLILGLFSWGMLFLTSVINYTDMTGIILTRFASFALPFLFLFTFIEVALQFKKLPEGQGRKSDRYVSEKMIGSFKVD